MNRSQISAPTSENPLPETYLEHLDESDTQVQVGHISANQTQTEEETDGNNGAQVDTAGHLHRLTTIEQSSGAGQNLGHQSRECQVPCCEDDRWGNVRAGIQSGRWVWGLRTEAYATVSKPISPGPSKLSQRVLTEVSIVEDVLVEENDTGTQSNPGTATQSAIRLQSIHPPTHPSEISSRRAWELTSRRRPGAAQASAAPASRQPG